MGHCTQVFGSLAVARAKFLGLEADSIIQLPHPMRTRNTPDVERIALEHVDRIVARLTAGGEPGRG